MKNQVFGRKYSVWMAESLMEKVPVFKDKWSYDYGVICKGLEYIYNQYGDEEIFRYIERNMGRFVEDDGKIKGYDIDKYNLDFINNGKTLLFLYSVTKNNKYLNAAKTLRSQLSKQPRISEGGFWHKKIYTSQMWLDGLYMAEPFYAEYIRDIEKSTDFSDVLLQFKLIDKYLWDNEKELYYHGYDESRSMFWADSKTGRSANFWGRSVGWYAMALIDTYLCIENSEDKIVLEEMIRKLAKGLMKHRDAKTGLWYQIIDKPEGFCNYVEASSSAMFIYFIKKSARLGLLDKKFSEYMRESYIGYIRNFIEIDENGYIDLHGTVYAGGLGGDNMRDGSYEYYLSEPVQKNSMLGIGPFMMAALEMEMG